MADTTTAGLDIRPLSDALGAEIRGVDLGDVSAATFSAIVDTWHRYLVLCFPGQTVTDEQFLAFSARFGELDRAPITVTGKLYRPELPELAVISNVIEKGRPIGSLGNSEAVWHSDMTYTDDPPMASMLYAIEIPPEGGNTGFCNMYRAYESLPDALKTRVATLTCKHDSSHNSAGETRSGFSDSFQRREDIPGAVHPLVCTHPDTGRKVLFPGRRPNAYIPELSEADSEALLDEMWSWITRAEISWHHKWRVGDVVMWDNRCTLHRRDEFDAGTRRIMHRSQIKGRRMAA